MKPKRRFSRRKFLALAGLSAAGTFAYGRWIESGWLGVGRHTVKLAGATLPQPIKVLQLSDLHASSVVPLKFIEKAIRMGLDLQPDLILLTGDFISGRFDTFGDYAKILRLLSENHPCYATFGNHDGGRWAAARDGYADTTEVRAMLDSAGVTVLHNRSADLKVRESSFLLVGLGDTWAGQFSPKSAFSENGKGKSVTTLVMSHNPDTKTELRDYPWDVMFCGHTHGGQLQIPLIGAPFAPVYDKRFVKGLHSWEGRWLHITKGVGNLLGVRLNCRPEISLVTLT